MVEDKVETDEEEEECTEEEPEELSTLKEEHPEEGSLVTNSNVSQRQSNSCIRTWLTGITKKDTHKIKRIRTCCRCNI